MALNCDVDALVHASFKFLEPNISEQEREAIEIYLRVKNLQASGGANYTDLDTLLTAAKRFQVLVLLQRKAIDLYIDEQNAIANGASINTDINSLQTQAKCYLCLPQETKKQVLLFLKCAINALGKPD